MTVPTTADVVVAGAGIVGCATAHALAKRGLKIVLVEQGSVGGAVSGASLACIGAHMIDPDQIPLFKTACALWQAHAEELDRDIAYQCCGQIRFIARESDFLTARRWLEREKAAGLEVELLDPKALRETVPALTGPVLGATWSPNDATVNPFLACRALVESSTARGAKLLVGTAVIGVTRSRERIETVLTSQGPIATPWLINACGPWARQLATRLDLDYPIWPRKAQCLATARTAAVIPSVVGACESDGGVSPGYTQIQQAHDGQILFNTVNAGAASGTQAASRDLVIERDFVTESVRTLLWLFPSLRDVALLRSWARYEAVTPDRRFLVGMPAGLDGFLIAAGDNGVGFTPAPLIAEALAETVNGTERTHDLTLYDPNRFTDDEVGAALAEQHIQ